MTRLHSLKPASVMLHVCVPRLNPTCHTQHQYWHTLLYTLLVYGATQLVLAPLPDTGHVVGCVTRRQTERVNWKLHWTKSGQPKPFSSTRQGQHLWPAPMAGEIKYSPGIFTAWRREAQGGLRYTEESSWWTIFSSPTDGAITAASLVLRADGAFVP